MIIFYTLLIIALIVGAILWRHYDLVITPRENLITEIKIHNGNIKEIDCYSLDLSWVNNNDHKPLDFKFSHFEEILKDTEDKISSTAGVLPSYDILKTIYNMQYELNLLYGYDTINDKNKEERAFDFVLAMKDEMSELTNCFNWKWWSTVHKDYPKYGPIDKQNIAVELIDIQFFWVSLCHIFDLTPDKIFSLYCQKYEINKNRMLSGKYNHLTKTEEDNKTIKV